MSSTESIRYRFGEFVLSPSRRQLLKGGEPVPLIPRYFDLLLLLIERRSEALHRRDILDSVWSDVVVSDGALNQAVRVLRRALGDDPREPSYIKTVSRHGYRFIAAGLSEESDSEAMPADADDGARYEGMSRDELLDSLVGVLLDPDEEESELREAAEGLHGLGTEAALQRIGQRRGHARARAYLRDSRWAVPSAGGVPILRQRGALSAARQLVVMRLHHALRHGGSRWAFATLGGIVAGLFTGAIGGLLLRFGPGAEPVDSLIVTMPVVGMLLGGSVACGIAAGLAAAEVVVRSLRGPALILGAAAGGGLVAAAIHLVGRLTLQILFGRDLYLVAGGFEGMVLGGCIGLGYAIATPTREGGMAAPRGRARWIVSLVAGIAGAVGAVVLAWTGSFLAATSLDFMAQVFPGSDVGLGPVNRLLGESFPGPTTHMVLAAWEGLVLGFAVIFGLTHRPH